MIMPPEELVIYAHHSLTFDRKVVMAEPELRRLLASYGFSMANLSHHLANGGFEYGMVIKTRDEHNVDALSRHLSGLPEVKAFRIDPVGD
jgi:putative Mg2+ transporter-C (MgtC) family protein